MTGVDVVTKSIQAVISHIDTHHALSTQSIHLTGTATAEATTYSITNHSSAGKSFLALGRYEDRLVKVSVGATDKWLIKERKAITMGKPQGDFSIFTPEQKE